MLRILDEQFNILETVPKYTSIEFQKVFNDYGSFTAQIPLAAAPCYLAPGRYLQHKNNYGIIQYIEQTEGHITVKGCDLKGLLAYRLAFECKKGKAESVIKAYVSDNTTGNRAFTLFNVKTDRASGADTSYSIEQSERLDSVVKNICEANDLGYDVTVSGKKMYFDVVKPSAVNCIYSRRYNNIKSYTYTNNALNCCTLVYEKLKPTGMKMSYDYDALMLTVGEGTGYFADGTGFTINDTTINLSSGGTYYIYVVRSPAISCNAYGSKKTDNANYFYIGRIDNSAYSNWSISENEPEKRTVTIESDNTLSGINRRETFLELSGSSTENENTVSKVLADNAEAENIEAEILSPEDYGTKWKLGDYVKLRVRIMDKEITVTKQISAVTEIYEANRHIVTPTFGRIKESVLKKIIRNR